LVRRLACQLRVRRQLHTVGVQYSEHGDPEKVLKLSHLEVPELPKSGHVRVRWLAAPVNPADINQIQGVYPVKPPLPATGGNEGVGRVEEIGANVQNIAVGDHVVPAYSGQGTWQEVAVYESNKVFRIDKEIPIDTAATLQVNPPTAYRMLKDFVQLKRGDTVLQNGANSAVGRNVIQIARILGYETVNVVRDRANLRELADELKILGADHVITEAELVKDHRGKFKNIRLALNCVGGKSSLMLAAALANQGVMVTYGGMSKQPVQVPTGPLIFKDIRLAGYWQSRWYEKSGIEKERTEMYADLTKWILNNELRPIKTHRHKLEDFKQAISAAVSETNCKQILCMTDGGQ